MATDSIDLRDSADGAGERQLYTICYSHDPSLNLDRADLPYLHECVMQVQGQQLKVARLDADLVDSAPAHIRNLSTHALEPYRVAGTTQWELPLGNPTCRQLYTELAPYSVSAEAFAAVSAEPPALHTFDGAAPTVDFPHMSAEEAAHMSQALGSRFDVRTYVEVDDLQRANAKQGSWWRRLLNR